MFAATVDSLLLSVVDVVIALWMNTLIGTIGRFSGL